METQELINKGQQYVMNTYKYNPIVIDKGEKCYLYDTNGKKYLDFVAGIAVNSLGYSNQAFVKNLCSQLEKFNHCSNLYWNQPQIELAETLIKNSAFDKVFFCNSGAESVEAALKLSRKYGKKAHEKDCYEIITMKNSFHGRTFGAISATGQEKYQKDITPLLPGIVYAEFNNFESIKQVISEKTCAIMIEPIQGEGGIKPADKKFLQDLRALCTEKDIVLVFDEVQCGIGRTGELFAYRHYGIAPDVICLAKGLGNGFPIGAMMAVEKIADAFQPGDHASTFGGNPLAATSAKTVLDQLLNENILSNAKRSGEYLQEQLYKLQEKFSCITDVRGIGLMQGIELDITVENIIKNCTENGLLLVGSGANVIRFVPPLIVEKKEIDEAITILTEVLEGLR
jgi:predicted acetylornithine/succinylornithine family transaminase